MPMVENWTASKHLPLKRGVGWTAHVLLIRLYMVAAVGAHLGLELAPFVTLLSAYVRESLLDAGLHAFKSADVYVGGRAREQRRHRLVFSADAILYVLLVGARDTREYEVLLEQAVRNFLQRPEVG